MSAKRFALMLLPFIFLYGCVDSSKDTLVKKSDYIVQKKPVKPSSIANIDQSISNLDYSKPNNSSLPLPAIEKLAEVKKELPDGYSYTLSSDILPWKVELHNKPLSDIKGMYTNSSNPTPNGLTDIVTYSSNELLILNSAFPEMIMVKKAYIEKNSNSISIKKSDVVPAKGDDKEGELNDLSFTFMNIKCFSDSESDTAFAKLKIKEILNIQAELPDVPMLIKIRYKTTTQFEKPLAIVTLVFDNVELSVNRSAVYSGACTLDSQYNQDQLLSSIQDYAKENKNGSWSNK